MLELRKLQNVEAQRRRVAYRRRIDPTTNRPHSANPNLWVRLLIDFNNKCAYCGITNHESKKRGYNLQIDHIVPVTKNGSFGGYHNAAIACLSCNASKGNRDLLDWLSQKQKNPHPLVLNKYHRLCGIYAA